MNTQDIMSLILAGVGIFTSVGFKAIPAIATWYYSIKAEWRGLSMAGIALVITALVFGLGCTLFPEWGVQCTQAGAMAFLKAYLILFGTNQLTYMSTPDSKFKQTLDNAG